MEDNALKAGKVMMDPLGALFAGSWRRYAERFWTLIWIFFVPSILFLTGQLLLQGKTHSWAVAGGLVSFIGSLVSIPASLALVNAVAHGTDFAASYRVGLKLFWPAVLISILNILAVLGGFVLLVVPGIILSIGLMFANYVLVVEDKRGMNALTASRDYVKGYWWAVLGRCLLLGAVFLGVVLLVYFPLALLLGKAIGAALYFAFVLCFSAFGVCYTYELYGNLRRLKAGVAAAAGGRKFLFVCMAMAVAALLIVAFVIALSLR